MATSLTIFNGQPKYSAVDPAVPLSDIRDFDYRGWEDNKVTESRIVHEIEGRFNASYDESRFIRQHEWRRNWEFAAGNQWIYWNEMLDDFCSLPVPEELRYTENQFRGTMRQGLNMLVQGDPAYDCVPSNPDWDSRESARTAKPYLYARSRGFNLGRLRVANVQDSILFGFGIRKTYWQSAGGAVDVKYKPQVDEETGESAIDEETGEPQPRVHKRTGEPLIDSIGYVGEMCQDSPSPWMWFPQVGREGPYLKGMDYCIDAAFVSPAWVERAHPGLKIGPEDLEHMNAMPYQLLQPGDLNWSMLGSTQNRRPPQGKVLMLTYYQIPAPKRGHECGLEIRICGSHVLYIGKAQTCSEKAPYSAPLPFSIFAYESRRGTFYPRPPASDWVEPQMRINQILSDMYTYADLLGRPNLVTNKGDGIPDVVSFGMGKWELNPGWADKPPTWCVPPPMPPQVFAMKQDAERALDRVAMLFGATRGERSNSDPSGAYLEILREHDQIDLLSTVRDNASSEEEAGMHVLLIGKKFEPAEQWLEIVGTNGKSAFTRFQKSKLKPEKLRVMVQATSLMPFLASSRRKAALEVYEKGLLGPPGQVPQERLNRLMKWMDTPNLYETLDLEEDDMHLAERLHGMIIDDQCMPIPHGIEQDMQEAEQAGQPPDPQAMEMLKNLPSLIRNKRAFEVDPDWDPNVLIPLAIDRKKEDDYLDWPDRSKQLFEQYLSCLKQLQSQHAQMEAQGQMQQMEAQLALQAKYKGVEQDQQAEGRAKVKVTEAVAKAFMQPDPHVQASADTKAAVVGGFAQHLFKWALAEEPQGRAGKPGGRDGSSLEG